MGGSDSGAAQRLIEAASAADDALIDILRHLRAADYVFVTPTPSTHTYVRDRRAAGKEDFLRDVFGWVRPFQAHQMAPELLDLMHRADVLASEGDRLTSTVRVSSLDGRLFLHSAPTTADDAVFLGPDSYRYARLLRQALRAGPPVSRALDIGTGAGVGALTVAAAFPGAEVWGSDINPKALRMAGLNARHADLPLRTRLASGIPEGAAPFDLIVANPPYIAGDHGKIYRDGGEAYGARLALDWVQASLGRLTPGGRFILYTGAAVACGRDTVRDGLERILDGTDAVLSYEEIDPDVFGRTLRQRAYQDVERIAAIAATIQLAL